MPTASSSRPRSVPIRLRPIVTLSPSRRASPCSARRVDPPIKRSADLGAETAARKLDAFSGDQSPVEPGRSVRCHLLVEVEIRADRQRDALPAPRILKPTQFHNAADRTVAGHIDVGKPEVMDASIDPVNNGKSRFRAAHRRARAQEVGR